MFMVIFSLFMAILHLFVIILVSLWLFCICFFFSFFGLHIVYSIYSMCFDIDL